MVSITDKKHHFFPCDEDKQLVFTHAIHEFNYTKLFIMEKRGATKHCCYGLCNSDSRYAYRPHMKNVDFIRFPKPWIDLEKCKKWLKACGRGDTFTTKNVNNSTYICTKHFVGEKGPTDDHPDPVPANFTPAQIEKIAKKRKPPSQRTAPAPKKKLIETVSQATPDENENLPLSSESSPNEELCIQPIYVDKGCQENPEMKSVEIQTESHLNSDLNLEVRIQNKILENENKLFKSEIEVLKSRLAKEGASRKTSKREIEGGTKAEKTAQPAAKFCDIEETIKDEEQLKFYTGLTPLQFMCLWNFLGPSVNEIQYWNAEVDNPDRSSNESPGPKRKLTPKNELYMTLIRLRMGLLHKDLAYRFGVSTSMVSIIILTWIQYLYKQFIVLKDVMFTDRDYVKKHLPKSFKKYKNIRCIIDCVEVFVQRPRNSGKKGNCYSSYKGCTTYKYLVAVAPNGAVMFVSDVYEGSISDKEIVRTSGFLDNLKAGDAVMADGGFNNEDLLMPRHIKLITLPFLGSRDHFTPQEEAKTKDIASVKRAIGRMKKFRILKKTIPLDIQPVFSQMVFVIGCLVNFQEPLVK